MEVNKDTKDIIEEFDFYMREGLGKAIQSRRNYLHAEGYFSDAAFVIKDLDDELKQKLCNKYEVNPMSLEEDLLIYLHSLY